MNAAYLYAQLEEAEKINNDRLASWERYYNELSELKDKGLIELPVIPKECSHNAHMFYIKLKDLNERTKLINYLKDNGIASVFHYVPLHSSKAGIEFGRFHGEDRYTTIESERILRLPLYYGLKDTEVEKVVSSIKKYFNI